MLSATATCVSVNVSRCSGRPPSLALFAARQPRNVSSCASKSVPFQHVDDQLKAGDHTLALKEWAVTVQALHDGKQQILLRKGGIREPRFAIKADFFPLFPTGFHAQPELLTAEGAETYGSLLQWDPKAAEHVPVVSFAEVEEAYLTSDLRVLDALGEHHIWSDAFLSSRLQWRGQQPITVLLLRVWNLEAPVLLSQNDFYWGCFSWVDLSDALRGRQLALEGPAVDDEAWQRTKQSVDGIMARLSAEKLPRAQTAR